MLHQEIISPAAPLRHFPTSPQRQEVNCRNIFVPSKKISFIYCCFQINLLAAKPQTCKKITRNQTKPYWHIDELDWGFCTRPDL